LTSAHQNDIETSKNINLKQIKKIQKFQNFSKKLLKYKKPSSACQWDDDQEWCILFYIILRDK